jgi:hypothetical protein
MFYLDVPLSNAMGLKPMDFSPPDRAVRKLHIGNPLHLLPIAVPIDFFKPFFDLDGRSFGYNFLVVDRPKYLSYTYVRHFFVYFRVRLWNSLRIWLLLKSDLR